MSWATYLVWLVVLAGCVLLNAVIFVDALIRGHGGVVAANLISAGYSAFIMTRMAYRGKP